MSKAYIVTIKFDSWQNQLWFMGENNNETEEKWNKAVEELENIKKDSKESIEFQTKAIDHLKTYGFVRIQK